MPTTVTETNETNQNSTATETAEERVRKVYVRDVQSGQNLHTVFRASKKQKSTSRQGKPFLALTLVDKTGELEARVFDNVDAADTAFAPKDYLLVKGRVITFHNKPQLVIETLDRLDPTPMDEKEFTPPPAPPAQEPAPKDARPVDAKSARKALRARIITLLDDPVIFAGIEALVKQLEKFAEHRGTEQAPREESRRSRGRRGGNGPRVEHKPDLKTEDAAPAPQPKPENSTPRDPSLPKDLIFKPFTQLTGEGDKASS